MADVAELRRQLAKDINASEAAADPAKVRRDLEYDVRDRDSTVRRNRAMRSATGVKDPTAGEATSDEQEDISDIEAGLLKLSPDAKLDPTSVTDTPSPDLSKALFDMARNSKEGVQVEKFKEYFPGSDVVLVPREGKPPAMVYQPARGEPWRVIPSISPAALASHLAREDTALSIGGAAAGAAAGGAMGGPPGAIAGGVVGSMAGDAGGQLLRQFIENARGFGEEFKIDPVQMLLAGGGQGAVEAWRVGGPAFKQYVSRRLIEQFKEAGLTERASQFALEQGITPPALGQISKNPVVRTAFNQATAISERGEQFLVQQTQDARALLERMAGEGDPDAELAWKTLTGQPMKDTAAAAEKGVKAGLEQFPDVDRNFGGMTVRAGVQEGLSRLKQSYGTKLDRADRLMRAEKAPFFDLTDVQATVEKTMEPKAFRAADGSDIPFGQPSPALQKLQSDILEARAALRTNTNQAGGTSTGIEQMRNLRSRAFEIGQEEPRALEIYKALSRSMDQPQNVTGSSVGYKNYLEGVEELKRYESIASKNYVRAAVRDQANEGNLAWTNFAPDKAAVWREWDSVMPGEYKIRARESIVSELVRMDPAAAIKKLDSFGNSKALLDDIIPPQTQQAIRDYAQKLEALKTSGLKERADQALTSTENVAKLAFEDTPAVLDQFLAAATTKQKEALRLGVFKQVLTKTEASPGVGQSLIDNVALERVTRQIKADPQRFLRFMSADDVKFLDGLNDYVGVTARRGDIGTSLKKAEISSSLGSVYKWITDPQQNLVRLGTLVNENTLAAILGKPSLRQGVASINGRAARSLEDIEKAALDLSLVPRDINLLGAIIGNATRALANVGDVEP